MGRPAMTHAVTGSYLRARFLIASLILMAALASAAGVSVIALRAQEHKSRYEVALQHLGNAVERLKDELDHLAGQSERGVATRHAARGAFREVLAQFHGLAAASRGPGGATPGAPADGGRAIMAARFGIDEVAAHARRELEADRMPARVARIWVPGSGAPDAGPSESLEYVIDRLLRVAEPIMRGAGPLSAAEHDRVALIKSVLRVLVAPRLEQITSLLEKNVQRSNDGALLSLLALLAIAGGVGVLNVFLIFRPLARAVVQSQSALSVERDRAVQAAEAKRDFLSTMSHELRTPMNGALGFASLLLASDLRPEQRRQVEIIRSSGQTLLAIVNDILDLSRMEADSLQLSREDFELEPVIADVLGLAGARAAEKGLETGVYIDPSLPAGLRGDADRVRQILTNLVGNAVKFTEHGSIIVEAWRLPAGGADGRERLELVVSDTGVGIAPDDLEHVFGRFTQAGRGGPSRCEGSGLGLAICRELAERMGGDIRVESVPGQGTSFRVRLPLEPAAGAAAAGADVARRRTDAVALARRRVLVVADGTVFARLVPRLLEDRGLAVDRVTGAAEARRLIESAARAGTPYAAVVVDGALAEGAPAVLAARLRPGRGGRCAPLLLAAAPDAATAGEGRTEGFDAVEAKPLMPGPLLETLARVVRDACPADPKPTSPAAGEVAGGSPVTVAP